MIPQDKFTLEERKEICSALPAYACRDFFELYPEALSALRPGYRAKTLSDGVVRSLYCDNLNNEAFLIYAWDFFSNAADDVDSRIARLKNDGKSDAEALQEALASSPFASDPATYLKLTGRSVDQAELLKASSRLVGQIQTARSAEQAAQARADEEAKKGEAAVKAKDAQIEELNRSVEQLKEQIETQKSAINEFQSSSNLLKLQNQEAVRAAELAKESEQKWRYIIDAGDFPLETAFFSRYPFYSVCTAAAGTYANAMRLTRVMDINSDGVIQDSFTPGWPARTDLWTNLYNGSVELGDGALVVMGWETMPNRRPGGKPEFVRSRCYFDISLTQICHVPGCSSLEDVVNALQQGIAFTPRTGKVLFACPSDGTDYAGILLMKNTLISSEGTVRIPETMRTLRVYRFNQSDTIAYGDMLLHRRIFLGMQSNDLHIKDPLQVVKEQLLTRCSKRVMSNLGVVKRDITKLRSIIESVTTDDFYQDVAQLCSCSTAEAKKFTQDFIDRSSQYLNNEDIEVDVLEKAIASSDALQERCADLLEKRWRSANEAEVKAAESRVKEVKRKCDAEVLEIRRNTELEREKYENLQKVNNECQNRYETLTAELDAKERLAGEVEDNVSKIIQQAREDAASFVAEMAFIHTEKAPAEEEKDTGIYTPGSVPAGGTAEEIADMEGLLRVLQQNLQGAGVSEKYAGKLAAFLYAACVQKTPLLLAGPDAMEICDAFSLSLYGQTAGVLTCEGSCCAGVMDSVQDPVVVIENPDSPEWAGRLPRMLARCDKFCIAVQPYAEDLLKGPRGMLNYFQPLLTELFVDRIPQDVSPVLGHISSSFQAPEPAAVQETQGSRYAVLGLSPLAERKVRSLMAAYAGITGAEDREAEYLFTSFPSAYVTGSTGPLLAELRSMAATGSRELAKTGAQFARLLGQAF